MNTTRKPKTGLVEKHDLPYGYGHVAIIRDIFGDGTPMFSVEIYRKRGNEVERVRCYSKLAQAHRCVMDVFSGACYLLHLEHKNGRDLGKA